jgi:thioredoxin-like negative regulator of GroEL
VSDSDLSEPAAADQPAGAVSADWERRVEDAWASFDDYDPIEFRAVIDELAAELPAGSPRAAFERAGAFDSTDDPGQAVPLYQQALDGGLTGLQRRRSIIQMASSIRNLGRPQESIELLVAELNSDPDELDDAVRSVLALALTDVGREREAVCLLLTALAAHLPRYQRSMAAYAQQLIS